jgi:hypothetical protein
VGVVTVWVLIEFTGTPSSCDGAVIQGVYSEFEGAQAAFFGFSKATQRFLEIQEHPVWSLAPLHGRKAVEA